MLGAFTLRMVTACCALSIVLFFDTAKLLQTKKALSC